MITFLQSYQLLLVWIYLFFRIQISIFHTSPSLISLCYHSKFYLFLTYRGISHPWVLFIRTLTCLDFLPWSFVYYLLRIWNKHLKVSLGLHYYHLLFFLIWRAFLQLILILFHIWLYLQRSYLRTFFVICH